MQYMGSKRSLAKHILPIILKDRQEGQWYVEPFCGGCNTLSEVTGPRIGSDYDRLLIGMWKDILDGWLPPKTFSVDEYKNLKETDSFIRYGTLATYVSFVFSYRNIKWNGYNNKPYLDKRNGVVYNKADGCWKNNYKQFPKLKDVIFKHCSYEDLKIPEKSIIYCDPPYNNTTGYKVEFNHQHFWEWVKFMSIAGHKVFVSEYTAPDDFVCVWSAETRETQFAKGKKHIEKLFVHRWQI